MDEATTVYTADVFMSPMGPHWYVEAPDGHSHPPLGMGDAITNAMNEIIADMNAEHGWPIDYEHIRAHTKVTEAIYTAHENQHGDLSLDGLEVTEPEVSMDWYSRAPLRRWNDELHRMEAV